MALESKNKEFHSRTRKQGAKKRASERRRRPEFLTPRVCVCVWSNFSSLWRRAPKNNGHLKLARVLFSALAAALINATQESII